MRIFTTGQGLHFSTVQGDQVNHEEEMRPSMSLLFSLLATSKSHESTHIDCSFLKSRYVKVIAIAGLIGVGVWGIIKLYKRSSELNNKREVVE